MLKINQIYKVKEGHEEKCKTYKEECGSFIGIIEVDSDGDLFYDILDKNQTRIRNCCSCFTEDDLELEEEVKEDCLIHCNGILNHKCSGEKCCNCNHIFSKQKSLEDLEVGDENTSDGYHTFKELYEFRMLYNALAFNELAKNKEYKVHKSKKHNTGEECFGGGWFIVIAYLPSGQISNHYELKDWHLFQCEEKELADEWDGHTSQEVVKRIYEALTPVFSPSEAETLLEEKLGYKVKIK